ncbi:SNF2 family N-terminal domain-containing protein [Rhexocercosporidium sp. MPI-PUGE-AT-0058]|nr:SNF2 family N-terminal domain-containing protein [Rhexocercosporidium sp. MPI-PUGE-AT-0058]
MPPKRGRPRKADSLTATPATSRPSSTRRSGYFESATTTLRLTTKSKSTAVNDDDSIPDFISAQDIGEFIELKDNKKKGTGRDSLSSVSDSMSLNEGSGYSTPGTSAVATPAILEKPSTSKRGRITAAMMGEATPAVNAVARAAALRNSQFSMNTSIGKRKRVADSEEDEDADDSDSPDAKLARDLQDQYDAAAISMAMDEDDSDIAPRRPSRKARKILPKTDFVSDYEDDEEVDDDDDEYEEYEEEYEAPSSRRKTTQPKVELGSKGKNLVTFSSSRSSKKEVLTIDDSDDSDDSDVPVVRSKPLSGLRASATKSASKSSPYRISSPGSGFRIKRPPRGSSKLKRKNTKSSTPGSAPSDGDDVESVFKTDTELSEVIGIDSDAENVSDSDAVASGASAIYRTKSDVRRRIAELEATGFGSRQEAQARVRLENHHPELLTMWSDLENLPRIGDVAIEQPKNITRELKPFQLQGVGWMMAMEKTDWAGGLLGDEMGMGKTIQAVSLIMSDYPAKQPSLVLIPPVAIMQWQQEIKDYTEGTLKTFVYHGTNKQVKDITYEKLLTYDVILMSYNSLESMFRKQEKGFKRKGQLVKEESVMHKIHFHRVILDEAHSIKTRTTGSARACFALKADHKWCLSGTPLQNRIGEFFSLVRFLNIRPFACYFCKQCSCACMNWDMNEEHRCNTCNHSSMSHLSVFNQELLNPIIKFGNQGPGKEAFRKLSILTGRFMLRRVKRDHSSAMELPAKEIYVDRQFFGEEENDFAGSIMNSGTRKFETYVAQGVLLNNYANIFGLIMQMRQVADHPDLILKKNSEGGQNVIVCCICDETAEEAIRSGCKHDFCRACAKSYLAASDTPDCPRCHIALAIDLEQPDIEQDEQQVKKSSIINRIKMENWTSSSKIETLVHDLHELRSKNMSHKSIIFSQFTTMLQLVEWRLRRAGITTVMLDGSMTPAQRQASINHFKTDVKVECFLVSLKAGGVALNLTEASKVFIVDPWWNPAAEWQSADRCHRIGQARPCQITRLCIEDSVESRMVLLQEKKANMINSTINSDQKAMESLTPEDMQFLFRGS